MVFSRRQDDENVRLSNAFNQGICDGTPVVTEQATPVITEEDDRPIDTIH